MELTDVAPVVLDSMRADWAEEYGFPVEFIAVGGAVLVICGVMMWAGRWRRWFTFNLPSSGDLPITAYYLMSAPYACTGIGFFLVAFGLIPHLPGVVLGAMFVTCVACVVFAFFEWVFVTSRNLEKLFARHPGGTRITRFFLVPWIHRFLEDHFSPQHHRVS